ncbi:Peptidase family M41 [Cupriavidus sp. YR651]|uniref:hypothetical protein n=1 Tax=Cupriavidus sp. YR651 TaxID=1855315 RepID=UPI000884A978|nr:Peptidase family M41 [Cupriavidus sp. YR651]
MLGRSELLGRFVLPSGRVVEQIVFGEVSTGAQNDLEGTTDMARQMITHLGMSESLGLSCYERAGSILLASAAMPSRPEREYSERTAQAIDEKNMQSLGSL